MTPEINASATHTHKALAQADETEDLPETTLRERYDNVDCTEEISKKPGIK